MTLRQLLLEYRDRVAINKKGYRTESYRINKICRHKVCDNTLFKLTKLKLIKFREEQLLEVSPSTVRIAQQEDPDMKQGIGALYKST